MRARGRRGRTGERKHNEHKEWYRCHSKAGSFVGSESKCLALLAPTQPRRGPHRPGVLRGHLPLPKGAQPQPPQLAQAVGDEGSSLLYLSLVDGMNAKGHLPPTVTASCCICSTDGSSGLKLRAWRAHRGLSQLILPWFTLLPWQILPPHSPFLPLAQQDSRCWTGQHELSRVGAAASSLQRSQHHQQQSWAGLHIYPVLPKHWLKLPVTKKGNCTLLSAHFI